MKNLKGGVFGTLEAKKDEIIEKWVNYALATYPPKAKDFFSKQSDPFLNPVGNILKKEFCEIYNQLLKDRAEDSIKEHVDAIVRVRAVQDFSPSSAVMIFWGLKDIVLDLVKKEGPIPLDWEGVHEFFRRIDLLCLLAFDIFVNCREKLWELKTKEFQASLKNIIRHYQVSQDNNSGQ